jgi:hypothetical protein
MRSVVSRFATEEPTACAVCRRHAVWLGYGPPKRERPPVIWLCDDNGCHAAAKKVYAMPKEMLDAYEVSAALEAGAEAGAYLEEISKTDIATLDASEWRLFLRRLFVGYELALRRKILNNEPPF